MADAKLTYRVTPPAAFVATNAELVITATNSSGADIKFASKDEIQIAFPSSIVANQNFSGTTGGSGYDVARSTSGNYFSVKAPFGFTLKPGGVMTITFTQVPIAATPVSAANIGITEIIGGVTVPVNLQFDVKSADLGIIAWLDKLIVGESQPATLKWQSSGGVSVVVSGFPTGTGQKTFPVTGKPPYFGSTTVYVPTFPPNPQDKNYTVQVFTGGGNHEQTMVTLQQNPPIINDFSSDPENLNIKVDTSVTMTWLVQFASSVILNTPTIANWRQPINANPFTTVPGTDLLEAYQQNYRQLPETADYILFVDGYRTPAVKKICFVLAPVPLVYFKFGTKDLKGVKFKTNPNWPAVEMEQKGNIYTFTIFQPGGKADVFYLGSGDEKHPQIQYFDYTKNGGKFQLSWITANLKTLVLNGNINIEPNQIVNGTLEVSDPGTYTLVGKMDNGLTINSVLDVTA